MWDFVEGKTLKKQKDIFTSDLIFLIQGIYSKSNVKLSVDLNKGAGLAESV